MKFKSLLGICLVAQIVTGLFLAINYCPNIDLYINIPLLVGVLLEKEILS